MYTILILTKQKIETNIPKKDGLRNAGIKITIDQYSCIIDTLKEYKELDYITNDKKYIANILLKNMNK